MANESLSISLSETDSDTWIRLEQSDAEEEATTEEVVDLLDDLYDIEACDDEDDEDESETTITEEDFEALIGEEIEIEPCKFTYDLDYLANIYVVRSDISKDYKLVLTNGAIDSSEIITEFKELRLTVEEATSEELEYPVTGTSYFSWDTTSGVITSSGTTYDPPAIRLNGTTLEWDEEVTGTIIAAFDTTYESLDVWVYNEDGEVGECTAIAFYEGEAESLELELPEYLDNSGFYADKYCKYEFITGDDKEPWVETETKYYCQCSGEYSYSIYSDPPDEEQLQQYYYPGITEVVNGGYVDCGETTGDINDPEFYEQTCCEPPPFALPKCSTYYIANEGGRSLSDEVKAEYIAKYGEGSVKFTAVSPEDGDCGYTKYTQVKISKNCCEGVTEIEWDEDNPDVLPTGHSITIYVTGGLAPYTFKTTSAGTSFGGGKTFTTSNPYAELTADESFCGLTSVTVTDGCSEVSREIRSDQGQWVSKGIGCVLSDIEGQYIVPGGSSNYLKIGADVGRYRQHTYFNQYRSREIVNENLLPETGDTACDHGCFSGFPSGYQRICDCMIPEVETYDGCLLPSDETGTIPTDYLHLCDGYEESAWVTDTGTGLVPWICLDRDPQFDIGYGVNYYSNSSNYYWEWSC